MKNIEEKAIECYTKNIEFLQKEHPDVMAKLSALDTTMQNQTYIQKYDLEYVNNSFDIVELRSKAYLYDKQSLSISQELARRVNFKKNSDTFEGFIIYNFSKEAQKNLDEKAQSLEGLYPLMSYYIQNSKQDDEMQRIEKFICIGVGLGIHIPLIDEKIQASSYCIIEDDVEIFKLSLFVTPWYELAKKSVLFFSIGENQHNFSQKFNLFLDRSIKDNRYLKYSYFGAHSKTKIKYIQNVLASQSFMTFGYKVRLQKLLRGLEYLQDGVRVLDVSHNRLDSVFAKNNVILLAAGPSLQENIEWLKKQKEKFIIIALSSVLQSLQKHNIKPDIVTHIDGFETSLVHFEGIDIDNFLHDTQFIVGSFIPKKLKTMLERRNLYFVQEDITHYSKFGLIEAPCIGSFTLLLALRLGCRNLFLLGLDFALSKSGETHSSHHAYGQVKKLDNKDDINQVMSFKDNVFEIPGNFREKVLTTPNFHQSINVLNHLLPKYKEDVQTIYNLSDGAKIAHTKGMKMNELELKNLSLPDVSTLLVSELKQLSCADISHEDRDILEQKLDYLNTTEALLKRYTATKIDAGSYMNTLLVLTQGLIQEDKYNDLRDVYYTFMRYALALVQDLLNTKELHKKKQHLVNIDAMIVDEVEKIYITYKKLLSSFLLK